MRARGVALRSLLILTPFLGLPLRICMGVSDGGNGVFNAMATSEDSVGFIRGLLSIRVIGVDGDITGDARDGVARVGVARVGVTRDVVP